jgi:hypothetical protein
MRETYLREYLKRGQKLAHDMAVDRSGSFSLANKGQLTTSEYVSYMGYLEDKRITERLLAENISVSQFPRFNPTKKQFEGLIEIIERLDLDLGLDSD